MHTYVSTVTLLIFQLEKVIKQTSANKFLHDHKTTVNLLKSTHPNIFLVPREPSNYRIKES